MTHAVDKQEGEVTKQKLANGDSVGPRLLGAEAALRVVAEQLPKIVPNMLINKRDGERRLYHVCTCKTVSSACIGLPAVPDSSLLSCCRVTVLSCPVKNHCLC